MWRVYDIWLDSYGGTRLVSNNYSAAPFGNLDAFIMSVSNAGIFQSVGGTVVNVGSPTTPAQYISINDAASAVVQDAAGNQCRILIPAPQTGIFLADQLTVNPAVLASLLAAALADGFVLPGGLSPTSILSGVRVGKRPV